VSPPRPAPEARRDGRPHLYLWAEADIGLSERGLRRAKQITPTLALHFPAAIIISIQRPAGRSAAVEQSDRCARPVRCSAWLSALVGLRLLILAPKLTLD
jgi:hypothetical protein